jgi:acyl-CoA dehydrogenase
MDFLLSDEQKMIFEYGRNLAADFGRDYWVECAEHARFPEAMYKKVAADGFVGVMVPEAYGGAGLGMTEMALFNESLAEQGMPLLSLVVGATMGLSLIASFGSEEQKRRYLPPACAGETRFCFAITEPDAGTNSMRISTVAKSQPDGGFRLNGSKVYITDARESDYMVVVTRTTPFAEVKRKTDGFTLFIVDTKAAGIEMQPIPVSVKIPETQYQVFFDNVELTADQVLGEVDRGFDILFHTLNPERILVGAICAGLGRYVMGRAVEYANERVVFKGPIGAYQALQHPLARAKTEIELAGLMTYKAAWLFDRGESCGPEANMAKLAGSEACIRAVDASLQCFGGNGFTKEYGIFDLFPVARLMRTIPFNNEMIHNYIAEHVMGLPRSY